MRETLTAGLGRDATVAEIATAMGSSAREVAEALADASRSVTTLEDPAAHALSSGFPLPEESAVLAERRHVLTAAVRALPERMRFIVQAVYVDERPVKEIAEQLGVSHSAVSQQRSEAVRLLRDALERYFADGQAAAPISRVSLSTRDAFFTRMGEAGGDRVASVLARTAIAL